MDFKRQSLVFQFVEKEEDLYFLIQIRKRTNRKGRLDDFKLQSYMYVSTSVDILLDSTRLTEILSWKKLSSEVSLVKFKYGIHSTHSSFHCFVSSKFRVLVEYFWIFVILMHLQKLFCPTKWWYMKRSFDNK